ncbi:MAG TPA: hypothetical protein ACFYD6_13075 [Candidatus Brocadiia bacterium]|nr:hypothetical protein [Candidatus Brocadiales bacterium]
MTEKWLGMTGEILPPAKAGVGMTRVVGADLRVCPKTLSGEHTGSPLRFFMSLEAFEAEDANTAPFPS